MLTRSFVSRRIVVGSLLAALAVLLPRSNGGGGSTEVFPISSTLVSHSGGMDSTSAVGGVLSLHIGSAAKEAASLDLGLVTGADGFWKTKAPEVITADFTEGFEAALEALTGHPAKCKLMKMPEIVSSSEALMGSIRSEYKAIASGEKVKVKLRGFFVSLN